MSPTTRAVLFRRGGWLLCVLAVSPAACRRSPPAAPRIAVRPLQSPAGPGSGEPSLTVAPDGRTHLTWIEPAGENRHALRFATYSEGSRWSAARTIAEGPDWFVNWADFPSMASLPDGTLFAHWLVKSGKGRFAYDVHLATSRDGGATWGGSVVPHRDGTESEHGFVSMERWSPDAMGIVWLDGRKTAAPHSGGAHAQGEMALMHTTMTADGRWAPRPSSTRASATAARPTRSGRRAPPSSSIATARARRCGTCRSSGTRTDAGPSRARSPPTAGRSTAVP